MVGQNGLQNGYGYGGLYGTAPQQSSTPASQSNPGQQQTAATPAASTSATTPTAAQTPGSTSQNLGWGSMPTINPGQVLPNSQAGDNPILAPQPGPNVAQQQGFMNPALLAPFYNAAGVAGNLGTQMAGNTQSASDFMNGIFNPNLNSMESSFMGAGLGNALVAQQQGFGQQQAQYEGTPFSSGLMQSQNQVMEQTARDLMSTSAQMGLQRENLGAQMANTPFTDTMAASQVAPQLTQQMFNMANTAYQLPYQQATQVWSGIPISTPTTVVSQGSGKGL